jgi:hypothetical protein
MVLKEILHLIQKYAANILAGKEFKVGKNGNVLYTNIKLN